MTSKGDRGAQSRKRIYEAAGMYEHAFNRMEVYLDERRVQVEVIGGQ